MNQHGRRSIVVRIMIVVLGVGLASGAIATWVATRAMSDTAEARLVDETTARTEQARVAISDRLAVAEAQLETAALLADAGRISEVPLKVADFVRAIRVSRQAETLELGVERVRALLPAADSPQRGRWLIGRYVAVRVDTDSASVVGLVDVEDLLPHGTDRVAELEAGSDARLVVAGVIVTRDRDLATATGAITGGLAVRYQVTLASAREEVRDAMRRAIGWTVGASVLLVLAIAWVLAQRVTRPIRALAAAVATGREGFVAPPLYDDEIGALGGAIAAMHCALAHDAQLLAVGADLARDVVQLQEPAAVFRRLEAALAAAHPQHGWRVAIGADSDRVLLGELDAKCATVEMPVIRTSDEVLVVPLLIDGNDIGAALGHGTASVDEIRSVEMLCHTALAAIKTIGLTRAASINDRLVLLGRMSASVAHEINNPLLYVALNLGILEEELLSDDHRGLVRETIDGVQRVAGIVRDLSRLSRGGTELIAPADLVTVVAEQLKIAKGRARSVTLDVDAPEPVWVSCARGRLGQAILNLIINAIDAVAGHIGGRVVVTVRSDGVSGVVTIADNGPGMPEEVRKHLFDAFFTTKGDQGTGLGLYLSRQYVQLQGGRLEVLASGASGTTFQIQLPVVAAETAVEVQAEAPSRTTRRRVLIIDDEPQILRTLERWLSTYAEVVTATGARDGLAKVREAPFSLVLCDWNMPGMGGREFLDEVRTTIPKALERVVIMSGGNVTNAGVRVVAKPLDRAAIREMLGV